MELSRKRNGQRALITMEIFNSTESSLRAGTGRSSPLPCAQHGPTPRAVEPVLELGGAVPAPVPAGQMDAL